MSSIADASERKKQENGFKGDSKVSDELKMRVAPSATSPKP